MEGWVFARASSDDVSRPGRWDHPWQRFYVQSSHRKTSYTIRRSSHLPSGEIAGLESFPRALFQVRALGGRHFSTLHDLIDGVDGLSNTRSTSEWEYAGE